MLRLTHLLNRPILAKASDSLFVSSSPAVAAERLEAPKLERSRARKRFKTCRECCAGSMSSNKAKWDYFRNPPFRTCTACQSDATRPVRCVFMCSKFCMPNVHIVLVFTHLSCIWSSLKYCSYELTELATFLRKVWACNEMGCLEVLFLSCEELVSKLWLNIALLYLNPLQAQFFQN